MSTLHPLTIVRLGAAVLVATTPQLAAAQPAPPRVVSRDTVAYAAGTHYDANGFQRFFLGNTYRDLWTKPVRVPVLDVRTYAGGLVPLKEGGGKQTKNLRFAT